jgi:hypothetical protein
MMGIFLKRPLEVRMSQYVHASNIAHYRKLIAANTLDPARGQGRHAMLLTLLAAKLVLDRLPPTYSREYRWPWTRQGRA